MTTTTSDADLHQENVRKRRTGFGVKTCPACGANTEVMDTRERLDGAIRRRRRCTKCPRRFTTLEIFIDEKSERPAQAQITLARAGLGHINRGVATIKAVLDALCESHSDGP